MSKEKYNPMIDEVYKNYCKNADEGDFSRKWLKLEESFDGFSTNQEYSLYTQEEFINKCKTNPEFSEKWGLKIEERELSLEERYVWYIQTHNKNLTRSRNQFDMYDILNSNNCPTKLITITYNNIKTEIYEN